MKKCTSEIWESHILMRVNSEMRSQSTRNRWSLRVPEVTAVEGLTLLNLGGTHADAGVVEPRL